MLRTESDTKRSVAESHMMLTTSCSLRCQVFTPSTINIDTSVVHTLYLNGKSIQSHHIAHGDSKARTKNTRDRLDSTRNEDTAPLKWELSLAGTKRCSHRVHSYSCSASNCLPGHPPLTTSDSRANSKTTCATLFLQSETFWIASRHHLVGITTAWAKMLCGNYTHPLCSRRYGDHYICRHSPFRPAKLTVSGELRKQS